MFQIIVVVVAFGLMPVLMRRFKLPTWQATLIASLLIHLVALRSWPASIEAVRGVFTWGNLNTVLAIILVGVLSALMKRYGMLDAIITSAKGLIHNRKILIALVPAVIGLLSVPGGAYLSAPFVNSLGEEMGMPKPRRAAVNLTYRHVTMLVSPFSALMLYITSLLQGQSVYTLIGLNLPFVAVMALAAARLYLPKGRQLAQAEPGISKARHARSLLLGLSPILVVLLSNALIKLPMAGALALAILYVWALNAREKDFMAQAVGGIKYDVALIIVAVLLAQNTVFQLHDLRAVIAQAFTASSQWTMLFTVFLGALFLGTITGLYYMSVGLFLPILFTTTVGAAALPYIFFIAVFSFLGYYFSPLHLCQVLTLKAIDVGQKPVFREHIRLAPLLALAALALFFAYQLLI